MKNGFQDVQLINFKENLGFGLANNLAMKESLSKDADYLFLLNQDTWVFPETIGNLVSAAEEYNNFGILSPLHYSGNEVVLDENFEKKKLLGLDKEFKHSKDYPEVKIRRNGGMWHWKK